MDEKEPGERSDVHKCWVWDHEEIRPERRGACVRSSFLQLPSPRPGLSLQRTPALHSPLLPSSPRQPPSWPPPGAHSPLLSALPRQHPLTLQVGPKASWSSRSGWGAPKCACLWAPRSSLSSWHLCVPTWAASLRLRGDPLLLPLNSQSPAQSHHPGYSCDGWMKPHDKLVAWPEPRSPSRASV